MELIVSLLPQNQLGLAAVFSSLSSHIAAPGAPRLQLSPQADHVLWRLVVRREIAVIAA
jgi:hypothetical protein